MLLLLAAVSTVWWLWSQHRKYMYKCILSYSLKILFHCRLSCEILSLLLVNKRVLFLKSVQLGTWVYGFKQHLSTFSCCVELRDRPKGKRSSSNYPPPHKWDKTFLLESTCLSTLCSLFLLTLPSGLYSVSCSVNIICVAEQSDSKADPFCFPAGGWWGWGKRQSLFTCSPPPPPPNPPPLLGPLPLCFLPTSHSWHLKEKNVQVSLRIQVYKQSKRLKTHGFRAI